MIKILLCCDGRFSSSALSKKIKKEIIENNMENDYYIEFSPFSLAPSKMSEFDITVCCPHLKFDVDKMIKDLNPDKPIYILPPVMYGMMRFSELSLDTVDVIDLYNQNKINPVCFPGEENIHKVKRGIAYRNTKKTP